MRASSVLVFALLLGCSERGEGVGLIDRGSCDVLIECASNLAPDSRDEFLAAYGEGGTCWNGGPDSWAQCRDACRSSLEAINLAGQVTGETCGTCESDGDCGANGACENGLCVGGGTGETGEDTGTPQCMANWPAPKECLRFVSCVGGFAPDQRADAEAIYGENGSCWCGTDTEAADCYYDCVDQLDQAMAQFPTLSECHDSSCSLDELDPSQTYGPVVDGACPAWRFGPQLPLVNPFDLDGSVCAPECSGIASSCPEHPQTSAAGTCYLQSEGTDYCVLRCWVNPTIIGGSQCQCGATCQPHGPLDGEGNARGICTFE